MKLSMNEIKWLKGFTSEELGTYLKDFPNRKETTEEFKKRYKYSYRTNKWKRI